MVGSMFFKVVSIDSSRKDLGISICIANESSELKSKKDFTVLEAFCYEAIIHSYIHDNICVKYAYDLLKKNRNNDISHDSLQTVVRKGTYKKMEADQNLRKALLNYYKKNKDNIGFTIEHPY